jgi:hypothetical protein
MLMHSSEGFAGCMGAPNDRFVDARLHAPVFEIDDVRSDFHFGFKFSFLWWSLEASFSVSGIDRNS